MDATEDEEDRMREAYEAKLKRAAEAPEVFAEELLGFELNAPQRTFLRAAASGRYRTHVLMGGRGVGKSHGLVILALWFCFREERHRAIYLGAQLDHAKEASEIATNLLEQSEGLLQSVETGAVTRLRLSNKSEIIFRPSSSEAVRGFHPRFSRLRRKRSLSLFIDEAGFVQRKVWAAAQGVLSTSGARAFYASNASSRKHWFYDVEFRAGQDQSEEHTFSLHVSAEDPSLTHIDKAFLAEKKSKLSELEYSMEILSQPCDEAQGYFGDSIQRAISDYTLPLGRDPASRYHLGIDLSLSTRQGSDWTVCIVAAKSVEGYRVADIRRYQHLDFFQLKDELADLQSKWGPGLQGLSETYESSQLLAMPVEFQIEFPSNRFQHEVFSHLHLLLRSGQLTLPDPKSSDLAQKLIDELEGFEVQVTDAGNLRLQAAGNGKDDTCYALAYAAWALRDVRVGPVRLIHDEDF